MVDLVRRVQAVRDAAVVGVAPSRLAARLAAYLRGLNIWFWAIVGLPTLLAGVYYFAIASDLYMSEVKFVVHSPSKSPTNMLSAMLTSASSPISEDTYAVHDYLTSRDVVRQLEREDDLRKLLSRPEGDFISRFPGIWFWRNDFEALYGAYSRFVSVDVDSTSGISTLQVKAYRPEDAQRIARALLTFSEELVNHLNARARHDALAVFQGEVGRTEARISRIQAQLTAYRVKRNMLDPKSAALGPVELLADMNAKLAAAKAQLNEVRRASPHSPHIPLLKTRIASLDKLIADERARITGNNSSIATALGEYERLDVQKLLAEKTLASAFASLEAAKLQVQRQQIYLETIETPNLADYPLYPKRFESFATVVAACLLTYGILWLLVASVREHASA
jgi:capsular polysaccharide transport system permease protein